MNQWIQKLILTAGGCALFAQPASAQQPTSRDHRKPAAAAPTSAAPASRDHRDKKKLGERDHRDEKKPGVRDHRDAKKLGERDHRDAKKPGVRDHRDAKKPGVRDHRDGKTTPAGHDHGGTKPGHDPKHGAPGTPDVRDHRTPGAPVPAPVTGRNEVVPSVRGRSNKRWSAYEIPVVKRYWPNKGKAGTTVTVLGANFGPELAVHYGETAIADAKITPTAITFAVPAGAANGMITARGERRRPLAIGAFEVEATYDAKAERKRRREERRVLAESNWKKRKEGLATDRDARLIALQEREAALQESRDARRAERRASIRGNFQAAFLADEATLAELALHAERTARLERMQRLAEANDSGKLIIRIDVAIAEENDRHTGRMATLKTAFQVN